MKNNKVLFGIIGIVALIVVNVVVFTTVKDFSTARFINIGFLNLSVIIVLFFSIMFGKKEYQFMNYSRLPIVGIYFAVTFLISTLFIICNLKSVTVTIVIQIILIGLFIIAISSNTMANNSAEISLDKDKNNYSKVSDMSNRLNTILKSITDRDTYKKVEKAYDDVRNSKININEDTTQIDNDIVQAIAIIEYNIKNGNVKLVDEQVNKIHNLVISRNQMS